MTIDKVTEQEVNATEKPQITVQNEIQKDVIKETMDAESTQKQLLQILASAQPQQQILQTAKDQIEKGYLDVKV
ncbi:MAG: hypothetical protein A2X61_05260 [Ignavibacteria bacterium GWB2_35_12]|nr:MAG: hypothetical protein A2X63_09260 [Ignavibacteria bacterium GWA2_35_8]OGU42137.1 MAG: hypothetical protein A2X61_05260 [Ignavibacteria bacterium GWB2_35_12]OGU96532.1 MAG: hypothetical protein A2220_02005 [Ignavibacteria bacterium RIFOXYA2_FULL_35_10]OGV19853.1 MAG: hypothetical protein A2475_01890 [Ignavibacteria bacterium RIFOXYC2_FULL_35_21]